MVEEVATDKTTILRLKFKEMIPRFHTREGVGSLLVLLTDPVSWAKVVRNLLGGKRGDKSGIN